MSIKDLIDISAPILISDEAILESSSDLSTFPLASTSWNLEVDGL